MKILIYKPYLLFLSISLLSNCQSGNRVAQVQETVQTTTTEAQDGFVDDSTAQRVIVTSQQEATALPVAATKRALLVGIDDYPICRSLYGCVNDVERMKAMLMNHYGFTESDILTLTNAEATHGKILESFQSHLIDNNSPNGTVVFYFSGHGSQTKDASGDETDLLDETLVAHGSRLEGGKDVLDDELNALLKQAAQKTSNITVILDACHSGDGVRSVDAIKRVPMRSEDSLWWTKQSIAPNTKSWNIKDENMAYTLMTSSSSSEPSYQYRPDHGSLYFGRYTHFLVKAIVHDLPINGTFKDLHDLVYTDVIGVTPRQYPTLEGNRTQYVFLGNEKVAHHLFIRIEPNKEGKLVINAGELHGMTLGSEFDVYPPGTKSTKNTKPVGRIKLVKVWLKESEFEVLSGKPPKAGSLAHEVKHQYNESSIKIAFLKGQANGLPIPKGIATVEPPKAHILFKVLADSLWAYTRFDTISPVMGFALNDPDLDLDLEILLSQWETWFFLEQLKNDHSHVKVSFTIEVEPKEGEPFDFRDAPTYQFKPKDKATLTIINHSEIDLYIHVLDLAFDGTMEVLYPEWNRKIKLAKGAIWTKQIVATLKADQKGSKDLLKIVVAEEPIDYQSLVNRSKGAGFDAVNPNQPFDWITKQVQLEVTR